MKLVITTPFAFKPYCLPAYKDSISTTIKKHKDTIDITYIVYDNSNDIKYGEEIKAWSETLGVKTLYFKDDTAHQTIENTTDYANISARIAEIYKYLFLTLTPADTDLILNIEDDVSFPDDALEKMLKTLNDRPEVVTVIGSCMGRRMGNRQFGNPIIFDFKKQITYPEGKTTLSVSHIYAKAEGIEVVGSGHVGLWLTRYPVLKELGWKLKENDENGGAGDITWGYRLWKENKGLLVCDWSIHMKHWWKTDGEVGFFTYGNIHTPEQKSTKRGSPLFIDGKLVV